eukprot:357793-Chlamydomonas_euryale.AAC.2
MCQPIQPTNQLAGWCPGHMLGPERGPLGRRHGGGRGRSVAALSRQLGAVHAGAGQGARCPIGWAVLESKGPRRPRGLGVLGALVPIEGPQCALATTKHTAAYDAVL